MEKFCNDSISVGSSGFRPWTLDIDFGLKPNLDTQSVILGKSLLMGAMMHPVSEGSCEIRGNALEALSSQKMLTKASSFPPLSLLPSPGALVPAGRTIACLPPGQVLLKEEKRADKLTGFIIQSSQPAVKVRQETSIMISFDRGVN